jgi:hypothetical protein
MEEEIINYDFQGWPIRKMSLKDILEYSGLFTHDIEKSIYFINDDAPVLNIYPTTLEDDGMGYGINEKFISDFTYVPLESNEDRINIFIEKDCMHV